MEWNPLQQIRVEIYVTPVEDREVRLSLEGTIFKSVCHHPVQLPEGVIRCASRLIEFLWGQVVQLGTQDHT